MSRKSRKLFKDALGSGVNKIFRFIPLPLLLRNVMRQDVEILNDCTP